MTEETETPDNVEATNPDENANVETGAPDSASPNLVTITKPDGTSLQVANTPENFGVIQAFSNKTMSGESDPSQGGNLNPSLQNGNPLPSVNAQQGAVDLQPGSELNNITNPQTQVANQAQGAVPFSPATRTNNGPGPVSEPETNQGGVATATNMQGGGAPGNGMLPYQGETSTSRHVASPEEQKAYKDMQNKDQEVMNTTKDLLISKGQNAKAEADLKTQVSQDQLKEMQDRHRQVDTETANRLTVLDTETKKLSEMKIDPSHAFGDGVTPSKILAGIGLALGAIGQAHGGGPNQAIGIIENAIKRDIEVQKANIEKQRGVVEATRGGLDSFMKVANNKEIAMDAEAKRQWDWVAAKVQQMDAGTANVEMKQKLAILGQAAAQKKMEFATKLFGATQTEVSKYMMPQMMGKDLPASEQDKILNVEMGTQRLIDLRNQLEKNPDLVGPLSGRANSALRKVGLDNPDKTKYQAELLDALGQKAGLAASARPSYIKEYVEPTLGSAKDKPETLKSLLDTQIKQGIDTSNQLRSGHMGTGHRMPNYPTGYLQAVHGKQNKNYEQYGGTVQPKPGM